MKKSNLKLFFSFLILWGLIPVLQDLSTFFLSTTKDKQGNHSETLPLRINDFTIDFSDFVYYRPLPYDDCTAATIGTGVLGVLFDITYQKNNQTETSFAATRLNPRGQYDVSFNDAESRTIGIEPTIFDNNSNRLGNGLTAFDIVRIQRHRQNVTLINCPISRIAADFNFDGAITIDDEVAISETILGRGCANDCPPNEFIWRFIPNLLVKPSITHPDKQFTADFWNNALPQNANGINYPFDATLAIKGENLTYNGTPSWLNEVRAWDYVQDVAGCSNTDYGFWLVKSGDMNASAAQNFDTQLAEEDPVGIPYNSVYQVEANVNNNYYLEVKIRSEQPIMGYQLGLKVAPEVFQIQSIVTDQQEFSQSVASNYNTAAAELNAGNIKTLWTAPADNINGIAVKDWTEILKVEITATEAKDFENELSKYVFLEEEILTAEFISGEGILTERDIELSINLVSKN